MNELRDLPPSVQIRRTAGSDIAHHKGAGITVHRESEDEAIGR